MASMAALGAGLAAAAGVCYCIAGSAADERDAGEQPPPAASAAAAPGQVLHVKDDAEFKALVGSRKTVIVDFSATWCGPCKAIAPLFAELAGSHPQAVFAKVDVDECEDTAEAQEVTAMPTFQAFSGGKKLASFSGADKQQLREFVQRHANGTGATGA